ncbi:hypothetical protein AXW67_12260 [Bradyrhizobium neotropicale]|uniref:Uncharacterized protein n=1 Tax=Bradyrhizobium neotropicale TaxID=1497615 RepID=A0A176Z735_9BRAD|nr:hypothetical protein [Bradyrhizobium neotropicale]OAF16529.1 hypothetical protein AXW67_12260 [Bradyrhizobium neotropicale]
MESASVPETQDPKPDAPKPDEPRADGGLTRAYEQIKSAEEDLARLDQLVSGLERGSDSPPPRQAEAAAERGEAPVEKAPAQESKVHHQGLKGDRPMLRAFLGLLLAIGVLGAAFASQYRDEAKAIMARWTPPAASPRPEVTEVQKPATPPTVLLAAADEPAPVPAPPVHKEAQSTPPAGATAPDQPSAELAQSLKTITDALASINEKLEQQKSRNEQTLREQADAIRQLKTAQEKDAGDNARLAAQVQALQAQLAASPAKPAAQSPVKENNTAAPRQHVQAAPPRRPRPPPRGPWMPPPYMVDPYGDPDW